MPRINLYNVYDNGNLIMEKVTRREIVEKIGCETISLTRYATEGVKYQDRYTFSFYGEEEEIESAQMIAFREKWNAAVAPFQKVIWVKSGGKQLRAGCAAVAK